MSQVWLITGSSRGLGRALAEAVLAAGHKLVATARDPAQLTDLVDRYGEQVRSCALDVTDPRAAGTAVTEAGRAFGRLDVLVNNAGYGNIGSIEDTSLEDIRARSKRTCSGSSTSRRRPSRSCGNSGRDILFSYHPSAGEWGPWGERLTPPRNGGSRAFRKCWPRRPHPWASR